MSDVSEVYPRKKADRRLLPHVPRQNRTRRDAERFLCGCAVTIRSVDRDAAVLHQATIEDVSDSGMLVSGCPGLEPGGEVQLAFELPEGKMPEGYESSVRVFATVVRSDAASGDAAFRFRRPLSELLQKARWRWFENFSLLLVLVTLVAITYIKMDSVFYFWFDVPVFLYGLCATGYLLSRFVFAIIYRPVPVDPDYVPSVSVIIPCFNEEEWIYKTATMALDQDYPPEKLEVVAVDDGSTDGSAAVLQHFKNDLPPEAAERFKVVLLPENRGKREALVEGTQLCSGELVVFVDSDSFLEPDAIRQLVQPMRDPRVAGACGQCDVENRWTNALTKMQAVRYFIGFRIFKAAESIFNAVTCLSGPLSCYRKSDILPHLDAWINQRFFGLKATFGDDRSLTNYVLRKKRTVYQSTAHCATMVPSGLSRFLKQQMRWKRSWLRESMRAASFMWRKEPFMAISFLLGIILPVLAPVVVLRAFVFVPLVYHLPPFIYLLGVLLMSLLMSSAYMLINRSRMWIYGVSFCFFYLTVLLWQMIPAVLTFWKAEWGTRPTAHDHAAAPARAARQA